MSSKKIKNFFNKNKTTDNQNTANYSNIKDLLDYIFLRSEKYGAKRGRSPEEVLLTIYKLVAREDLGKDVDGKPNKRGAKAYNIYKGKKSEEPIIWLMRIENALKTGTDKEIKLAIKRFDRFINDEQIVGYILNTSDIHKDVKKRRKISRRKLETQILAYRDTIKSDEFLENIKISDRKFKKAMDIVTERADERLKSKSPSTFSLKLIEMINCCDQIIKPYGNISLSYNNHIDKDYIDRVYGVKEDNSNVMYRIILGTKESITQTKKKKLIANSDLRKFGFVGRWAKGLSLIYSGKTQKKYEYQKEGSEKKKFSYRYKVYSTNDSINKGSNIISNISNIWCLAPHILKKLGYTIRYKDDVKPSQSNNYGALGKGSLNMVYEEADNQKNTGIKRIIRICISSYDEVKKERKGNKVGIKAFLGDAKLSEKTREEFYGNEKFVLNKNKHFGQIKNLFSENELNKILKVQYGEEKYTEHEKDADSWYCVSTGMFMPDGGADKGFSDNYKQVFNINESEKPDPSKITDQLSDENILELKRKIVVFKNQEENEIKNKCRSILENFHEELLLQCKSECLEYDISENDIKDENRWKDIVCRCQFKVIKNVLRTNSDLDKFNSLIDNYSKKIKDDICKSIYNVSETEKNEFRKMQIEKIKELKAFTEGLLKSLAQMHEQGLVHLDVKPENVMKEKIPGATEAPYYKYKLTDFGTAANVKRNQASHTNPTYSDLIGDYGKGSPAYSYLGVDKMFLKEKDKNIEDGIEYANPKFAYKMDSPSVGICMCVFYGLSLNGHLGDGLEINHNFRFPWKIQEAFLNKNIEPYTKFLNGNDKNLKNAKDLAEKLMELDLNKRLSCQEALNHEFITQKIK